MTEEVSKICVRKINENIRAVEQGKSLTLPLRELKWDCRFMKFYNDFYNIKNADRIAKEEQQKKEQVKARQRARMKAYNQRPEVKARQRAYEQRPEVKARKRAYHKAYNQRPEVKAKRKAYYEANKEKWRKYNAN